MPSRYSWLTIAQVERATYMYTHNNYGYKVISMQYMTNVDEIVPLSFLSLCTKDFKAISEISLFHVALLYSWTYCFMRSYVKYTLAVIQTKCVYTQCDKVVSTRDSLSLYIYIYIGYYCIVVIFVLENSIHAPFRLPLVCIRIQLALLRLYLHQV